MEKRDPFSLGPDTGFLVDELDPRLPAALQHRVEIVDSKADVMDAGSALRYEARDWGGAIVSLQQLHQGIPCAEPDYARPIRIIESRLGQTQDVPEERNAPCEGLYCDPDVGYSGAAWG